MRFVVSRSNVRTNTGSSQAQTDEMIAYTSRLTGKWNSNQMAAVLRAILGYYFLVFMMRVAGRRPGKQMTPMEFILVFFSGGLVLTCTVADDKSLVNAFSQIVAIALSHYVLVLLRMKWPLVGRIVDGTPLVLLEKGRWHTTTMAMMQIMDDDVMAIARDQGLERLDQIDYAVLERNGELSIIPIKEQ